MNRINRLPIIRHARAFLFRYRVYRQYDRWRSWGFVGCRPTEIEQRRLSDIWSGRA